MPLPPSSNSTDVSDTPTPRVSSSVIVTVAPVTVRPPDAVPATMTVSSSSSTSSDTGVSVSVAMPLVWPVTIVSIAVPAVKSSDADAVTGLTDSATVRSSVNAPPFSVPVTLSAVCPSPSPTSAGDTESVTPVAAMTCRVTTTV